MDPQGIVKNLQKDYVVSGKGDSSDSDRLQQAIDELAGNGDGTLFMPEGTYLLHGIQSKSNIHLVFDAKAVIKGDLSRKKARRYTFFALGGGGDRVSNMSIRSKGGRARVEFPVIPESDKAISVI